MEALTEEEKKAIASLKRLAKKWPPSLWLFATGALCVMKTGPDGRRVSDGDTFDQDYLVDHIDIPNDGGGF